MKHNLREHHIGPIFTVFFNQIFIPSKIAIFCYWKDTFYKFEKMSSNFFLKKVWWDSKNSSPKEIILKAKARLLSDVTKIKKETRQAYK
jgi:hypothetical protein